MVNVNNALRSMHNVVSPRLVPKTARREETTQTTSPATSASSGDGDAAADFRALFSPKILTPSQSTPGSSTTSPASTSNSTAGGSGDVAADFRALFSPKPVTASITQPAPAPAPLQSVPTLESVFGANPFMTNPGFTGPDGKTYGYNPVYFATPETAAKLAQMYGGTVVQRNYMAPNGGFQQTDMNQMIQFPNGAVLNAGLLASYFNLGLTQTQIDQTVATDINSIQT